MFSCFVRRMNAMLNRTHWAIVPARTRRLRQRHRTVRPRLEILEDRTLPSATLPVSVASSGTVMGNGSASIDTPAVSANGQYEVFTSTATDLVNGVTIQNDSGPGAGIHIYWRNLSSGTTALVDVATSGTVSGNHSARDPSITADGRYVAFVGYENNLTNNDASATQPQIYVRDMQAGQTYMVSLGIDGNPENGGPNQTPTPSITEDGNGPLLIAYQSNATNLTANDTSSSQQAFLATLNLDSSGDIQYSSLKTTLVSAANGGNGGNGDSLDPILSKDGSTLTFTSYAANLNVPGGYSNNSGVDNLYQYSLANQRLSLLSAEPTTTTSATGNGTSQVYNGLFSSSNQNVAPQSISANGQYVVFSSYATNLVPGLATYDWDNVYRRDLVNGTTSLVSINAAGTGGAGAFNHATLPVMTPDGRYIAFDAGDTQGDLTNNDPGGSNVFVRDMQQGKTYLVSLAMNGSAANGGSAYCTIAENSKGQLVIAYLSVATNLTSNPITNNGDRQVFVTTFNLDSSGDIEYNTLTTKLASATSSGAGDNGDNHDPILSKDGSTLAFVSSASNLAGENGTGTQLFAYNVTSGTLTQVSPNAGVGTTNSVGNALGISDNGQYMAYHYISTSNSGSTGEVLAWNANTDTITVIDSSTTGNSLTLRTFGDVQLSGDGSTIAYNKGDVFGHNWFEVASNWQSGSPTLTTISDQTQVFTPSSPSISISENGKVVAYQFEDSLSKYPWVVVYDNGTTTQVGNGSGGAAGSPIVSADGSTVVFNYTGNDLVSGITDFIPGQDNVFAYNVAGNTVSLVSAKAPGVFTIDQNINGDSVSDTGRYLAYFSTANDLLGSLSASNGGVFAEDVQQGVPTVIAGNSSFTPLYTWVISGDGSTVAFQSGKKIYSVNWLAANPTTTLVSDGSTGYHGSSDPSISDNGQLIAFESDASLTANDANANGYMQIFFRNLPSNTTTLVSSNSAGTDGGNGDSGPIPYGSGGPVLSADGSTVVYDSSATDLVSGLTVPNVPQQYTFLSNPSAPAITSQPSNLTVNAGQTATFTVTASGSPPPMIQWQVSTDDGKTFTNISGATSATLTLSNTQASQNGTQYQAVLSNIYGTVTTNAVTLTVDYAPVVTTNPSNQTVTAGQNVTFTAAANGNPTPTVQWQLSTDGGNTFTNLSGAASATLTLPNVTFSLNGNEYRAVFTNSVGSTNTIAATLTVQTAPAITSGNSAAFTAGQGGSFTVTATGSPTPTLTESGVLPSGVTFTNNGNGTAILAGTPAAGTQGTYPFTLTANNAAGSVTQSFTLTVNAAIVPPSPPAPPVLNAPPLLAFFDQLLGATETVNADGSVTETASFFGMPLLASTFDSSGNLESVTLFGIDVTLLFELL